MGKRGTPVGETHRKMIELYSAGYRPADIGRMLNRSHRQVCATLRSNGFSPEKDKQKKRAELQRKQDRRSNSEKITDRISALINEGFNTKKIAVILGYSHSWINKLLRRKKILDKEF